MHAQVLRRMESSDVSDQDESALTRLKGAVDQQPGHAGTSILLDRVSGASLSITFWEDEDALQAGGLRETTAIHDSLSIISTGVAAFEDYEVAVRHLPQPAKPGNWVRVTGFVGDPTKIDEGIRYFEAAVIPDLSAIPGFRGAMFLVNRSSGRVLAATVWTTQHDFEAGADAGAPIRARAAEVMAATNPRVEGYELVSPGPLALGR